MIQGLIFVVVFYYHLLCMLLARLINSVFLFLDHIFDQDATNQIIFDKMAKQIVHSAIQGFNGTIFAYGQTSSGKFFDYFIVKELF